MDASNGVCAHTADLNTSDILDSQSFVTARIEIHRKPSVNVTRMKARKFLMMPMSLSIGFFPAMNECPGYSSVKCIIVEILTMIESRKIFLLERKTATCGKSQDRLHRSGSIGLPDVCYELINLTTNDNLINNKI